jgi:4-amino-4-deoxy-L-arabinose transferase-like glycosyltransferase
MSVPATESRLDRYDLLLLLLVSAGLFGCGIVFGGELLWSEAIVPQTARTLRQSERWLIPERAGGPWLEGAPLAQWITVLLWSLIGGSERAWTARLPSLFAACGTVLLTASLAARWFGRSIGLLSGLVLATCSQVAGQAWRADESSLLTCLVTAALTLFARAELPGRPKDLPGRGTWPEWLGARPLRTLAFFVMLGATNLTGPLWLGPLCALVPIGAYLLWNWDAQRWARIAWLWGWLLAGAIALAWPLAVAMRIPDAWQFWEFDWQVRWSGEENGTGSLLVKPFWFYLACLPWVLAPWSLFIPAGVWMTRHEALAERYSPQRFVWCWGMSWPLLASVAPGKSLAYLLPSLPAWSILMSFGLLWLRDRIVEWPDQARRPWPLMVVVVLPLTCWLWLARSAVGGWRGAPLWLWLCPPMAAWCVWNLRQSNFQQTARAMFGSLALLYVVGFAESGWRRDPRVRADATLLRQIPQLLPTGAKVCVDMSLGTARGSWCELLLGDRSIPLLNLTFLPSLELPAREALVLTDGRNRVLLDQFGESALVQDSDPNDANSLKLYRVIRRESAHAVANGVRVTPLQAKYPVLGPYLDAQTPMHAQSEREIRR